MSDKKVLAEKILDINWAYAKTSVLAAGVELDVFSTVELKCWLYNAGFRQVEILDNAPFCFPACFSG